jgi:hypothetical protein
MNYYSVHDAVCSNHATAACQPVRSQAILHLKNYNHATDNKKKYPA